MGEHVEDIQADEGDQLSCILEKVLLRPKKPTSSQRHAIFKSRCTIEGKVCDLIIGTGCSKNIIANAMVKKLQLKTSKHPNFSIEKNFSCEVLCNVIEMDVSHLILGLRWQFDVRAWYDGHANAYTLDWKNKRVRLLPSTSNKLYYQHSSVSSF